MFTRSAYQESNGLRGKRLKAWDATKIPRMTKKRQEGHITTCSLFMHFQIHTHLAVTDKGT